MDHSTDDENRKLIFRDRKIVGYATGGKKTYVRLNLPEAFTEFIGMRCRIELVSTKEFKVIIEGPADETDEETENEETDD